MRMTKEELMAVADAARLDIPESDRAGLATELSDILEFTEQLGELPADLPEYEPHWPGNVMRDDVITPPTGQALALEAAPESEDGFLKVPRTVDADG